MYRFIGMYYLAFVYLFVVLEASVCIPIDCNWFFCWKQIDLSENTKLFTQLLYTHVLYTQLPGSNKVICYFFL